MESFKDYLDESNSDLNKIIKQRKRVIKDLQKLKKYVAKDDMAVFSRSLNLLNPKMLEGIQKYRTLGENKILQKNITGLIKSMENQILLPGMGPQVEKILKEDYYNVCDALAGIIFIKIDPKLIIKENIDESRAGIIGALGGGMLGMLLGGPIGATLGVALGGAVGEDNIDVIDGAYYGITDMISSIDPEEAMMTAGIGLGTFAGVLTGTLPVAIAGGLVGGVVSSILYDEVAVKGKVLSRSGKATRKAGKSIKKFTLTMYNNILDKSIFIQRRRMSKKLKDQWKLRKI